MELHSFLTPVLPWIMQLEAALTAKKFKVVRYERQILRLNDLFVNLWVCPIKRFTEFQLCIGLSEQHRTLHDPLSRDIETDVVPWIEEWYEWATEK